MLALILLADVLCDTRKALLLGHDSPGLFKLELASFSDVLRLPWALRHDEIRGEHICSAQCAAGCVQVAISLAIAGTA